MKLIIQIPCWNEEESLPITVKALPRSVPGFDVVELLVIDDGSSDRTIEVARELGVDHVIPLVTHQGLARAFERGVLECIRRGADVVVNTDADNQYCADDIPALVLPIVEGRAEIVVGDRDVPNHAAFSWLKRKLHGVGSYVVRVASNTNVPDAPSGFRAFSRRALLRLSVHSKYTYTHETLIQAGLKDLPVVSVPIRVNPQLRPSRLFKSIGRYVLRSANTIVRIYLIYNAFHVLSRLGLAALALSALCLGLHLGLPLELRPGTALAWGAGASFLVGAQLLLGAVIADLLAVNRKLQEEAVAHLRALRFGEGASEAASASPRAGLQPGASQPGNAPAPASEAPAEAPEADAAHEASAAR